MSKKTSIKPLSIALGAAFVTSMAASNIAGAAEQGANPFALNELSSGYQIAKEGKCGEGKCGGKKGKKGKKEGTCGEKGMKEGKCGEGKGMKEGKCGGKGKKEGKCGEGKCGGKK